MIIAAEQDFGWVKLAMPASAGMNVMLSGIADMSSSACHHSSHSGAMMSRTGGRARRQLASCLRLEVHPARCFATAPPPLPGTSSSASRKPIEPTTFADKSAPRQVYERPEQSRGMPPANAPSFSKPLTSASSDAATGEGKPVKEMTLEEAFSGPSRPRLVYAIPSRKRKDLPKLGVSE